MVGGTSGPLPRVTAYPRSRDRERELSTGVISGDSLGPRPGGLPTHPGTERLPEPNMTKLAEISFSSPCFSLDLSSLSHLHPSLRDLQPGALRSLRTSKATPRIGYSWGHSPKEEREKRGKKSLAQGGKKKSNDNGREILFFKGSFRGSVALCFLQ